MLSVKGSRELTAAVLALKYATRDVRNDINRATRATLSGPWTDEVMRNVRTKQDRAVIAKGVRILPGNPPVAVAAGSKRRLPGGLVPAEQWQGVEFGSNQGKVTTYSRRSRRGGTHQVKRHTTHQLPTPAKGRVAYRALARIAPRAAALWVQLIVRKLYDALEGS